MSRVIFRTFRLYILTDQESGDKDGEMTDNLSGKQLRVCVEIFYRVQESVVRENEKNWRFLQGLQVSKTKKAKVETE